MGIPGFFSRVVKKLKMQYRDSAPGTYPSKISGLLIDFNDLLHFMAQKTYLYGDFKDVPAKIRSRMESTSDSELEKIYIKRLLSRLDLYLTQFNPTDYFILAIDGPVPLAKMAQQRIRRFAGGGESDGGESAGRPTPARFDQAAISPGTPMMERVHLEIKKWFDTRSSQGRLPPFACYTSHHDPGEGEHKIIKILLDNVKRIPTDPSDPGMHFYCGQDGDLMMLGLTIPFKNVVFYREDRKEESKTGSPEPELFMIDAFRAFINRTYLRDNIDADFILMYFVFGNDFVNKNPAFSQADDTLMDLARAYIKGGKRLVDTRNGIISRKNLIALFGHLIESETNNLDAAAQNYNPARQRPFPILTKNTYRDKRGTIRLNIDNFKKDWYTRAMETYNELRAPCQEPYEDMDIFKRDMFENYLEMLQWNLDYYLRRPVSWNSQYRFYFAPLLSDLAMLNPEGEIPRIQDSWSENVSILRQLIIISHPSKVKDFIPSEYYSVLNDEIIQKMSPYKVEFFWDGKNDKTEFLRTFKVPNVSQEWYDAAISKASVRSEASIDRLKVSTVHPDIYLREDIDLSGGIPRQSIVKTMTAEKFVWIEEIS